MSSKPESRYYSAIHKLLPKELHKEKMHNPYRGGTADVWYSGTLDDLWVEYKYLADPPKRAPIAVRKELSPLQLHWLRSRLKEGRNVIVILGTPIGSWVFESLEWETLEFTSNDLKSIGRSKQQIADYINQRTMLNTCQSSDTCSQQRKSPP